MSMDKSTLAPILAGIGIGWLAFSSEGQKLAKGLGQSIVPALAGGGGGGESGQQSESKKDEDEKESKSKEDKED